MPRFSCDVVCSGLILFNLIFCSGAKLRAQEYPEVTIPNTEVRTIKSKLLGQELVLNIKLPASYRTENQRVYPVMYATDANRSYPAIANIAFVLEMPSGEFEEFILVGIGYKISNYAEWGAWRTRDLTPVNVPASDQYWTNLMTDMLGQKMEVKTGGAGKFLDCLITEVIPFVESNYRASPAKRTIAGYSYGGLFSLYTLFTHPEVFQNYFAGSPSISFGHAALYDFEEECAKGRTDLPVKLFMTAGNLEQEPMVSNVEKMAETLKGRNYPGLTVEYRIFDQEDHRSCYPSSLMWGIRNIYTLKKL